MNKIISYLGFAKKSNNLIVGQTALKKCLKQINLVLVCHSASENLKNLAKNLAIKHKCDSITTKVDLSSLVYEQDIKIVGILDDNLSKAIIDNKEKIKID